MSIKQLCWPVPCARNTLYTIDKSCVAAFTVCVATKGRWPGQDILEKHGPSMRQSLPSQSHILRAQQGFTAPSLSSTPPVTHAPLLQIILDTHYNSYTPRSSSPLPRLTAFCLVGGGVAACTRCRHRPFPLIVVLAAAATLTTSAAAAPWFRRWCQLQRHAPRATSAAPDTCRRWLRPRRRRRAPPAPPPPHGADCCVRDGAKSANSVVAAPFSHHCVGGGGDARHKRRRRPVWSMAASTAAATLAPSATTAA